MYMKFETPPATYFRVVGLLLETFGGKVYAADMI
jgi:hypothetical protein